MLAQIFKVKQEKLTGRFHSKIPDLHTKKAYQSDPLSTSSKILQIGWHLNQVTMLKHWNWYTLLWNWIKYTALTLTG